MKKARHCDNCPYRGDEPTSEDLDAVEAVANGWLAEPGWKPDPLDSKDEANLKAAYRRVCEAHLTLVDGMRAYKAALDELRRLDAKERESPPA